MATVNEFEELEVWKKARALSKDLYKATKKEPFCRDYYLAGQVNKSAASVKSNIAEGFERDGHGELMQFLSIAKGSAGELRSQIHTAYDRDYFEKGDYEMYVNRAKEVSRMLHGFIGYLKQSGKRGKKYVGREEKN